MVDDGAASICGVVLLPDAAMSARCVELSAALARLAPSYVHLGTDATLPHVTVAHFDADPGAAHALWTGLPAELGVEYRVAVQALYLWPRHSRVWVGLDVVSTPTLRRAHDTVVGACAAAGLRVRTESGDAYWPHVSLARWDRPPAAALPTTDIPQGTFSARLALARMGEHGTAAKVLAVS